MTRPDAGDPGEPAAAGVWRLDPALVHLNHGSYGACPVPVLAAQQRWRDALERDPTGFFTESYYPALDAARHALGAFLGADPAGLVFVTNATTAVNAVVCSLEPTLGPGDEILVTDHTYNACRNAVEAVAARRGARVVTARIPFPIATAADAVEAVLARASGRTRLAVVDHVTSPTALVLPVAEIVAALEPGVPVLVDGAHAPGMVPLALDATGASFTTGNAHKWLCAPKGAAFLHVRADQRDLIEPVVVSHGWNGRARADSTRFHGLFDWPGTFDPSAWLAVPDALAFGATLAPGGWPDLMAANHALAMAARGLLSARLGVGAPCPEDMVGAMAALPWPGPSRSGHGADEPGAPAESLRRRLRAEHGIVVPVSPWPGPHDCLVRVSAQRYNRLADYEALAAALLAG